MGGYRSVFGWLGACSFCTILQRPKLYTAAGRSLPRQHQRVFLGKDANYEGIETLCYHGAETLVASAKGRHQRPKQSSGERAMVCHQVWHMPVCSGNGSCRFEHLGGPETQTRSNGAPPSSLGGHEWTRAGVAFSGQLSQCQR